MSTPKVLIAGGGISGFVAALTLHQIGVDCVVFERVSDLKPMGVGINLQPNAVRELFDLGFAEKELNSLGIPVFEWALVGQNGRQIYSEKRGTHAGYKWDQYAMHRGDFHMALVQKFRDVAGPEAIKLGCRGVEYSILGDKSVALDLETPNGLMRERGTILIGADGIHSAIRGQMHPKQPPIHWGGAVMWRGTSLAKPVRTKSSFIGLGNHWQRMVIYPISPPDPETGLAVINWIAEVVHDDRSAYDNSGWYRQVKNEKFIHYFKDWNYEWINVPELIEQSELAFENPMIDRDPIPHWVDGPVVLLGDAAHPMFPTGSNGASQAIIDGRVLGAKFIEHGVTKKSLQAYNDELCEPISSLVLRNRSAGPFGLLNMVNERCGGNFDNIEEVMPVHERAEFMAKYQAAAGFARDAINSAAPTIRSGAKV